MGLSRSIANALFVQGSLHSGTCGTFVMIEYKIPFGGECDCDHRHGCLDCFAAPTDPHCARPCTSCKDEKFSVMGGDPTYFVATAHPAFPKVLLRHTSLTRQRDAPLAHASRGAMLVMLSTRSAGRAPMVTPNTAWRPPDNGFVQTLTLLVPCTTTSRPGCPAQS